MVGDELGRAGPHVNFVDYFQIELFQSVLFRAVFSRHLEFFSGFTVQASETVDSQLKPFRAAFLRHFEFSLSRSFGLQQVILQ